MWDLSKANINTMFVTVILTRYVFYCPVILCMLCSFLIKDTHCIVKDGLYSREQDKRLSLTLNPSLVMISARTETECTFFCLLNTNCCAGSFNKETLQCSLDNSGHCCPEVEFANGEVFILDKGFDCSDCIHFGTSMYMIEDTKSNWQDAVDRCICLRGKLCEIESKAENDFIQGHLRLRNSATSWLGGYNFNSDQTLEWISNPDIVMPYNGMHPGEPSHIGSEFCVAINQPSNYTWIDAHCSSQYIHICEFDN